MERSRTSLIKLLMAGEALVDPFLPHQHFIFYPLQSAANDPQKPPRPCFPSRLDMLMYLRFPPFPVQSLVPTPSRTYQAYQSTRSVSSRTNALSSRPCPHSDREFLLFLLFSFFFFLFKVKMYHFVKEWSSELTACVLTGSIRRLGKSFYHPDNNNHHPLLLSHRHYTTVK